MTLRRRSLLLSPLAWAACATTPPPRPSRPDGWAAAEGGIRIGPDARTFDVSTRAELDAALAAGDAPKRLLVRARIDLSGGQGEAQFRDPAFDLDAYCAAYAPQVWGRRKPEGPLESARRRSAARQAAAVTLRIPPRTLLVGAASDAGFANGMLLLDGAEHVVIRNLRFEGVRDHFPQWDPLDGERGAWNSDYDLIALRRARHVWIDHCSLTSAGAPMPERLGRLFQQNDGLLDITRESDLVTVSWCRFEDHDKTMLIGSSDSQTADAGRLRVSLHHNLWQRCTERTPRVRFGQVHLANNVFVAPDAKRFAYSIGVGVEARIVSAHNAWETDPAIATQRLVRTLGGSEFHDTGSLHNGVPAAWFERARPAPAFVPPPIEGLRPAREIAAAVRAGAGPSAAFIGDNFN